MPPRGRRKIRSVRATTARSCATCGPRPWRWTRRKSWSRSCQRLGFEHEPAHVGLRILGKGIRPARALEGARAGTEEADAAADEGDAGERRDLRPCRGEIVVQERARPASEPGMALLRQRLCGKCCKRARGRLPVAISVRLEVADDQLVEAIHAPVSLFIFAEARTEPVAQHALGPDEQRFHPRNGRAENFRRFGIRQLFAVSKHDRGALAFRQGRDRRRDLAISFIAFHPLTRERGGIGRVARFLERKKRRAPPSVERKIKDDAIEPRAKGGRRPPARSVDPDAKKSFLHDFLGVRLVAGNPARESDRARSVTGRELAERSLVALGDTQHKLFVARWVHADRFRRSLEKKSLAAAEARPLTQAGREIAAVGKCSTEIRSSCGSPANAAVP